MHVLLPSVFPGHALRCSPCFREQKEQCQTPHGASNAEIINNICLPAKVPVIAGEEGICSGCGVATLSIDYYDIGYKAGEMGAEILMDGKDVKEMPIEFAPEVTKKYNKANCEALGITVPDDYVVIEE